MTVKGTKGVVRYLKDQPNEQELYQYIYESPDIEKATNLEFEETEVTVTDIRENAKNLLLSNNGMEFHKIEGVPDDINWDSNEEVEQRYYPIAQALLQKVTGASRVHIFDHTLRKGQIKEQQGLDKKSERRQPAGTVHVDYTVDGGVKRLHMVLPDEADELKKTPFAIVQIWRPLKGPVKSSPLGMIDVTTVKKEDYLYYNVYFPSRRGSNYGIKANPEHKWMYAADMRSDEAFVFVCYDSRSERVRFTPHTGFRDLSSAPDAPPRESIEIRSLCFWQQDEPREIAHDL